MKVPAQLVREGDVITDKDGLTATVVWARTGFSRSKGMRTAIVLADGMMRFVPYRREIDVVTRGPA